ncbi:glycine betaine ABC transporter substrate-binding protein [Kineosporia babensis]|uniref:ABC-type glycine betaine transport system substrate-binding domain-containing protein n=1 Tax=Kineosporia babensis TaxID=499548 RepID=A0A9X1STA1_9ACTN|nr:glycine betaine ABC transporter substrate-binding protein [Kineosporia babensis]MCD5310405.1 hypothetical protein [Kineosporia babensis]
MKRETCSFFAVLTTVVALTACAGKEDPDAVSPRLPFEGATFTVASKGTTENILLGKMTAAVLSAHGATIVDETENPKDARAALTSGAVDMYWEYTGAAWVSYRGNAQAIADPVQQYQEMKVADAAEGIAWLDGAPVNNSYAIAVAGDKAKELRLESLTDLAKLSKSKSAGISFCIDAEFSARKDGFTGMTEAYGIRVDQDKVKTLEGEVISSEVAKGQTCTFGEVFATDGRISALGLKVLTDDRYLFPSYSAALTLRQETLDQHPKIADYINSVTAQLDDATMTELNTRVDAEGEDPEEVAESWLQEKGLI